MAAGKTSAKKSGKKFDPAKLKPAMKVVDRLTKNQKKLQLDIQKHKSHITAMFHHT